MKVLYGTAGRSARKDGRYSRAHCWLLLISHRNHLHFDLPLLWPPSSFKELHSLEKRLTKECFRRPQLLLKLCLGLEFNFIIKTCPPGTSSWCNTDGSPKLSEIKRVWQSRSQSSVNDETDNGRTCPRVDPTHFLASFVALMKLDYCSTDIWRLNLPSYVFVPGISNMRTRFPISYYSAVFAAGLS